MSEWQPEKPEKGNESSPEQPVVALQAAPSSTGDMVERIARELHRASYESGRRLYPHGAWEALDRFERWSWLYSARAALEAIREPTGKMLLAADNAGGATDPEVVDSVWRAMIDAALSPLPEPPK